MSASADNPSDLRYTESHEWLRREGDGTVTVGITAVQDAFGVAYARTLAGAVMAGLPVALAYLLFQRRVTQAITLSAGIKG